MDINLKIGGYQCVVATKNKNLHRFLSSKYSPFIDTSKTKPSFIINIKPTITEKFKLYQENSSKVYEYHFTCPNPIKRFKKFNIFFKSAFGWYIFNKNCFLLHASCVLYNNQAYIFTGKSGSGKSTVTKLLNHLPCLSDDSCIIKRNGKDYYYYGNPFYEKNPIIHKNSRYKIKAIFLLKKSSINKINRLKIEEVSLLLGNVIAFPMIYLSLLSSPFPNNAINQTLKIGLKNTPKLFDNCNIYLLEFRKDKKFLNNMIKSLI